RTSRGSDAGPSLGPLDESRPAPRRGSRRRGVLVVPSRRAQRREGAAAPGRPARVVPDEPLSLATLPRIPLTPSVRAIVLVRPGPRGRARRAAGGLAVLASRAAFPFLARTSRRRRGIFQAENDAANLDPDSMLEKPAKTRPRLFLIDGYALIYRSFFAMINRPLKIGRGENTSAAWGVTKFLLQILEEHEPA